MRCSWNRVHWGFPVNCASQLGFFPVWLSHLCWHFTDDSGGRLQPEQTPVSMWSVAGVASSFPRMQKNSGSWSSILRPKVASYRFLEVRRKTNSWQSPVPSPVPKNFHENERTNDAMRQSWFYPWGPPFPRTKDRPRLEKSHCDTCVVKCKYCVSQKRNEANDRVRWYNVFLTFIY